MIVHFQKRAPTKSLFQWKMMYLNLICPLECIRSYAFSTKYDGGKTNTKPKLYNIYDGQST